MAASVAEYNTPTEAPGSGDEVVICSGAIAEPPSSGMLCGVPVAVSVTVNVAVRKPVVVGVNATPTTQTAWAFKTCVVLHGVFPGALKLSWKSSKSVPVIVIPVIVSAVVPVLFRNAYSGALACPTETAGNMSGFGNKLTVVPGIPVPLNATVCGAPAAALLIVSVAKNGAGPLGGVNVTVASQVPPAGIEPPQVLAAAKAAGLV
ncbi:MAG: hypothetical protein WCC67_19825, partial [Candidatus Acidiferrales bacterium]